MLPDIEHLPNSIKQQVRKSLRMVSEPVDLSTLRLGESRIGGRPDVPDSFEWPTFENLPLSFIAQIDLASIDRNAVDLDLPSFGSLLFFYDCEQRTWGFAPRDRGSAAVIFATCSSTQLKRVELPNGISRMGVFKCCSVDFRQALNFPSVDSLFYEPGLSEVEVQQLFCFQDEQRKIDSGSFHRLGGHADCVQYSMELECALVNNGLYCGDSSGYSDPRRTEIETEANEWRLLLQIDSDDSANMMWGDVGTLYFWIRKSDLATRSFDRSWLIFQCC
jgi:uncharacterized protein YwqG